MEFVQKSPAIQDLESYLSAIRNGTCHTVPHKVIDDVFDAFGIIVKENDRWSGRNSWTTKACDQILVVQYYSRKQYHYNRGLTKTNTT